MKTKVLVGLWALLGGPVGVRAQVPSESAPVGRHQHDGVFVRMTLGAGRAKMTLLGEGAPSSVHAGEAAALSLAVGGAVRPNLIVFGQLTYLTLPGPTVSQGGTVTERLSNDRRLIVAGLGPGLTYYFAENYFMGLGFMLCRVYAQDGQRVFTDSKRGVALDLRLGREWWLSDNWGVGVFVSFEVAGAARETSGRWKTQASAVGLSATFN
ncbi:MAG: hypothetical protein KA712_04200 [Myxococcales bacterium]|nr:hypothetical protein [Myxococcales bacterium]